MAYTKMELILELLKNSSAIKERALLNYSGPWGKLLLIREVSGIVTFPGFFSSRVVSVPKIYQIFRCR